MNRLCPKESGVFLTQMVYTKHTHTHTELSCEFILLTEMLRLSFLALWLNIDITTYVYCVSLSHTHINTSLLTAHHLVLFYRPHQGWLNPGSCFRLVSSCSVSLLLIHHLSLCLSLTLLSLCETQSPFLQIFPLSWGFRVLLCQANVAWSPWYNLTALTYLTSTQGLTPPSHPPYLTTAFGHHFLMITAVWASVWHIRLDTSHCIITLHLSI